MGNSLEVSKWKTTKIYEALTKKTTVDGEKIRIPVFQRGLCWTAYAEEKLIDSLYNSLPIGSLLFYKKYGLKEFVLIDGLQRANTIKKFYTNRENYFKIDFLSEETISLINRIEEEEKLYDFTEFTLKLIREYIEKNKKDSSFFNSGFVEKYEDIQELKKFYKLINSLSAHIVHDLESFSNIDNYEVPVIIFESDNNEVISEIFKRINSEGKKLSIYDIYAASWSKKKFKINNDEIIDFIIKRYENYLINDLDVDDYDKETMITSKEVNPFEFVFGFSKLLAKKYQNLFGKFDETPDLVNEIAFELLNLCFGSDSKDMDSLDKNILNHSNNINDIVYALDFSCEQVSKIIKPYIYFKGNQHKNDFHILHSHWQILTLIAYVFKNIYNIYADFVFENKNEIVSNMRNRLRKYYVFDILCKNWREGNIAFAYKTMRDNRYSDELDEKSFAAALDTHFEMQLNYKETQSVNGVSSSDYIVLNTIYKKIFTAEDQLDDEAKFDVEHLCPKKQMYIILKKISGTIKPDSSYGLPISSIANLCYLPSNINRSKKEKTIYQDSEISEYMLKEIEDNYSFTSETSLYFLNEDYENNFIKFKENYFSFLRNRYLILKKLFIESLGYNYSAISEFNNSDSKPLIQFDEMKVGKVAKAVFTYLLEKGLLSIEELNNLTDKEYCKNNFKLTQYPVFSQEQIIHAGKNRYYAEPIEYNNKKYYLTSEWYEESRDLIINYYYQFK